MRSLVLFSGLFRRAFIEFRRYTFNTLSGLVTIFFVFLLIFYGAKWVGSGPDLGNTLSEIVVGFMMWILAIFALDTFAWEVSTEALTGTLEQMAMSPLGLTRVMVLQVLSRLSFQLMTLSVLLVAMMATSGRWLHIDVFSIVPLLILVVASVWGLGFVAAGLAIVFKRIQQALQILQFVLVALIAAPISSVPAFKFVPLAWGSHLVDRVMIQRSSILDLGAGELSLLVWTSAAWLAVGVVIFKVFERMARDRGLLGHY